MMPPANTSISGAPGLAQQAGDLGQQPVVRPGENRESDRVDILLHGGGGDLLRGLAQAGVDHFETGVAEGAGHHFGAAVVPVQAGLGDQDSSAHVGHPLDSNRGIGI